MVVAVLMTITVIVVVMMVPMIVLIRHHQTAHTRAEGIAMIAIYDI